MDAKRAARYAGKYALLKCLGALLGLVPTAAGGYYAYRNYQWAVENNTSLPTVFYAFLALALVGLVLWQFLTAWAFYATITDAVSDDVSDTYDTEKVKSDILSVLDSRLSDVQNDIQGVNRSVQDVTRPDEDFSFDDG